MIIIGLVILIAAVVVGVAGVLSNSGSAHPLTHHFAVFGYHVTGSTGTLFLYGIVVGAVGVLGLSLLLAGARRTFRRGREARRGLRRSRRETAVVSQDRDNLLGERETARAYTASTLGNDAPDPGRGTGARGTGGDASGGQRTKWHLWGPQAASPQPVAAVNGHAPASPDIPADESVTPD